MISIKFIFLVSICFFGLQVSNAGDIKPCTTNADCTSTQRCILPYGSNDIDTVCVELCTSDADCGGGPCDITMNPDVEGRTDFNTCTLYTLGCSSDAQCAARDWLYSICNIYTLHCVPDPTAMTTERPTTTEEPVTTAPPCNDKVVGGFRHNLFVLIQMLF